MLDKNPNGPHTFDYTKRFFVPSCMSPYDARFFESDDFIVMYNMDFLFFLDKNTSNMVYLMRIEFIGDCLVPHPNIYMLARLETCQRKYYLTMLSPFFDEKWQDDEVRACDEINYISMGWENRRRRSSFESFEEGLERYRLLMVEL